MPTLTLQGGTTAPADCYLSSSAATTVYNGTTFIIGTDLSRGTKNFRTIMKFDISAIPRPAVIHSITLNLASGSSQDANGVTYNIYRIDADKHGWNEAQATWTNYITGTAWGTAGGDYETKATEIFQVVAPSSDTTTFAIADTSGAFKRMAADALERRKGALQILIRQDDEGSSDGDSVWYSRTGTTAPQLVIVYNSLHRWRNRSSMGRGLRRTTRGF